MFNKQVNSDVEIADDVVRAFELLDHLESNPGALTKGIQDEGIGLRFVERGLKILQDHYDRRVKEAEKKNNQS